MIKLTSILNEGIDLNSIRYDVSIEQSDPSSHGVSEKDLPNMTNWPLRTRDQEPYVVIVNAFNKNNILIGKAMFGYWGKGNDFLKADSVYVIPRYRKLGIANQMYNAAEKKISGHIMPSAYQTSAGKGLWKKRLREDALGKSIESIAASKGYKYSTYRGDIYAEEITSYSPKERREHGIFTTPIKEIAAIYASNNDPRQFFIKANRILDLTKDTLENMRWVNKWGESAFDDWRDPQSGEEVSPWYVLEGGRMFDYEGTWSAERWMDLQATAESEGYDVVILPDYDRTHGIFPSWVVFDEKNLKLADPTTYDDNKIPIPLNLRFNSSSDDIRY